MSQVDSVDNITHYKVKKMSDKAFGTVLTVFSIVALVLTVELVGTVIDVFL